MVLRWNGVRVRVRVTLRLAVYRQTFRLCAESLESHGQNFFSQLNTCGHTHLQLLLALASAFILRSESRQIRDHSLLSQISDVPFCRLLRLAGLQWRYSTPLPHEILILRGIVCIYCDVTAESRNSWVRARRPLMSNGSDSVTRDSTNELLPGNKLPNTLYSGNADYNRWTVQVSVIFAVRTDSQKHVIPWQWVVLERVLENSID
jgi:hypothetical protein